MKVQDPSIESSKDVSPKGNISPVFNEEEVLHDLKHYLPAQAPLKDFIHHNSLHAFQNEKFFTAIRHASEIFGYKVSLTLSEFRTHFSNGRIRKDILEKVIVDRKGKAALAEWKERLVEKEYTTNLLPRVGLLRLNWKFRYKTDLDSITHPALFRVICNYLDQGVSIWHFPLHPDGFLASLREMEKNSYTSFFKKSRAKKMLLEGTATISDLLKILVGDESLYKQYLFDQQFAHQGWSGMVASVETLPENLLDRRKISLHDVILFELLLEIDALDWLLGEEWRPLSDKMLHKYEDILAPVPVTELNEVYTMWQEAFEWSYYDMVLAGMKQHHVEEKKSTARTFQAMFCIDDREESLRRYIEGLDENCETFGTPGFFGVEFYYQPENGKFYTKLCPAPVTPKYLIKEVGSKIEHGKDVHFSRLTHYLFRGWLIPQTLGFWSAFKLLINIFRPHMTPATSTSLKHMDKVARLTIENDNPEHKENGLQIGFTVDEMVARVEGVLKSIGLVKDFAPLVYMFGHGSSSVNNPHYAAYDCGACSGRPGSVNARVFAFMANHLRVRAALRERGIDIPDGTYFVGGLHDTTRDEMMFYDEDKLPPTIFELHQKNEKTFLKALDKNAKERSRRFESTPTKGDPAWVHDKVKKRSVSLFEPRPELNHATNALCIVGRRVITKGMFLDRRSFFNSYDYRIDPDGKYLLNIMRPAAPVCGGINLEYFFSRVDNQKLGAGTKLPHNVMGLFGVANGTDGDLRPGLPSQMIEVHDPVRLLTIIEHFPDVILQTLQKSPETYEWFINEWINLVAFHPETREFYLFKDGAFVPYQPLAKVDTVTDVTPIIENEMENLPVYELKKN